MGNSPRKESEGLHPAQGSGEDWNRKGRAIGSIEDFERRRRERLEHEEAMDEHKAYWTGRRMAFFGALGCVVLPLAAFGVIAVAFVIYAVFIAAPV